MIILTHAHWNFRSIHQSTALEITTQKAMQAIGKFGRRGGNSSQEKAGAEAEREEEVLQTWLWCVAGR